MKDILDQFGIDQSEINLFDSNPDGLIKLRSVYAAAVESMKGTSNLSKEEVTKLKEQAKSNEQAVELAKTTMSTIREVAFNATDEEQDSLVLLIEGLEEFLGILKFDMKEWINGIGKSDATRVAESQDAMERYNSAEALRKLILSVWSIQKANLDLSNKEIFGEDGIFPVKDSKMDGVVPNLPRMPDKPGESNKKGRPVHSANLRFEWNGKKLPVGTMGPEVAKTLVSDKKAGVHVTWKAIRDSLSEAKKDLSKDSWELKFSTGTLKGWIEKAEQVTSKGKTEKTEKK